MGTAGIMRGTGPSDTVSSTTEPRGSRAGSGPTPSATSEITPSAATSSSKARSPAPIVNPAVVSAVWTSAAGRPTRSGGTSTSVAPSDTVRVMARPSCSRVSGSGSWPITSPGSLPSSRSSMRRTSHPKFSACSVASTSVSPTKVGTSWLGV